MAAYRYNVTRSLEAYEALRVDTRMPEGSDIIAEREFFIDGKRNGGPAVVFRLWRPYQPKADYPRCRYELIADGKAPRPTMVPNSFTVLVYGE